MRLDNSLGTAYLTNLLRQSKEHKSKSPTNRRSSKSGTKIKIEQNTNSKQLTHKSEKRFSLNINNTLKRT